MRKLFSKARNFGATMMAKTNAVLADNKGESFIDTAIKILIAVVLGALLLAGLYLLFNSTILPTLTQKVTEMFDYKG